MLYFPKRPIDRRGFYRRRSWNSDIPRYDDVVFHMDAGQSCYADIGRLVPCEPGQNILGVQDLGQYGYHATSSSTTHYPMVIDSGFPAIQTTNSSAIALITAAAFQSAMQIVVFRSAGAGWNAEGCVFGRTTTAHPYRFAGSGTGFNVSPVGVQRQNGVSMTLGTALQSIQNPGVACLGHASPATILQWYIGRAATFANSLFIYEILAFSSILPVEDIEQIEAYLIDKYGIAGG